MEAEEAPTFYTEFTKCLGYSKDYQSAYRGLKCAKFKPTVQAYAASMDRLMALPAFLSNFAVWVSMGGRAAGPVAFKHGVAHVDFMAANGENSLPQFKTRLEYLTDPWNELNAHDQSAFAWQIGGNILNQFTMMGTSEPHYEFVVDQGVQNIFYSMVLGAYVAFESLASDMWVEGVNLAPRQATGDKGAKADRQITIKDIEAVGFDLRKRMGELMKKASKVDFQSLEGIQQAYDSTFKNSYKPHPDLLRTAKIRHLIAHRSGRVDHKFKEDAAAWPEYANLPVNSNLKFTGQQVAGLITPCVESAVSIIISLDKWGKRYGKSKGTSTTRTG